MTAREESSASQPTSPSTPGSSTQEERDRWRQRAMWLSQLGLTAEDPTPVAAVEEIADAVLTLLAEVQRLELERAERAES